MNAKQAAGENLTRVQDDVVDNKAHQRFELNVDGHMAFADYRVAGNEIHFTHTLTPPQLRGRGVASRLVKAALTSAKKRGLRIVPRCSFIANYIALHPEFAS